MPKLVRLYIRQVITGFGLAGLFVAMLIKLNIGNLGYLISQSDMGVVAVIMLVFFNGIVFAGVQFAISIMRLADDDPSGGKREPRRHRDMAPVRAAAVSRRYPLQR